MTYCHSILIIIGLGVLVVAILWHLIPPDDGE